MPMSVWRTPVIIKKAPATDKAGVMVGGIGSSLGFALMVSVTVN